MRKLILKTCTCGREGIFKVTDKNAIKALHYGDVPVTAIFPEKPAEQLVFLSKGLCPICQRRFL